VPQSDLIVSRVSANGRSEQNTPEIGEGLPGETS
jgi:hypothetical protein